MKKGVLYTFGASIILIICFIAFVLPSSLSKTAQQQEGLVFGKYNGKKISYEYGSDFTNFLSQYAQMYRNQGVEITQSNQMTIYNYAFNSTVIKYQQEDALKAAGYEVPQNSINLKLKNYFKDSDGKFSMKAYKQADPTYIENLTNSIKESLYTGRYYDDYYGTSVTFAGYKLFGLKSAEAETEFLDSFCKERRSFNVIHFDTGNYPEEEQIKFGKSNPDKFTKYDLSVITVEEKDMAAKVISRISKGQITFEDAVAEYSEKNYSDSDGKLTNNSQYQIENILKEKDDISKITSLAQDEISPAVETLIGFSIFKNNASPVTPDFSNEDTIKDVQNYISIYETSVVEDYFADMAKDFVKDAKASDLETAVAKYDNATLQELPAFVLNYGSCSLFETMDTSSITALSSADTNEDFLKQAFTLKLNDYSDPIIIGGDIVVLQHTGSEAVETPEDAEPSDYSSDLVDFDQTTSQNAVFSSPKLQNDFIAVYFDNFLSSSF